MNSKDTAAVFVLIAIAMTLGALLAGAGLPTRIIIPPSVEWVCVGYEHGNSCRTADAVRHFILDNGQ